MRLERLLSQKRSDILRSWLDRILDAYPPDTKKFLKKKNNQFSNPVGYTLSQETEKLFNELLTAEAIDPPKFSPMLDRIIRIRAIQDLLPSQAVAFVFLLKGVIREVCKKELLEDCLLDELLLFESKIDKLAATAFDVYMSCREKIFEIKANHLKNHVSGLLRRADLLCEIPDWDTQTSEESGSSSDITIKTR